MTTVIAMLRRLRMWLRTLKVRLAFASVLLISACVALTTHLVLDRAQTGVQRALMELEVGNAEHMAGLVSNRVLALQVALRSIGDDAGFAADADDALAVRRHLCGARVLRSMFVTLFFARADGRVTAICDAQGGRDPGISIAGRGYFQRTLQQRRPVVSEALEGKLSKEPIIQFTVPVAAADGTLVGVAGGTLRLASSNLLDELTQRSQVADDPVETIVIDGTGRVLAHRSVDRILRMAAAEPALADAMQRWEQQGRPVEASGDVTLQRDGRIVASAGVPAADWVVLRVADQEALLGGVQAARRDSLRLAGGVALAGGFALLGLLQLLLRPLARLQRHVQTLGQDGRALDADWPRAGGEIGALSVVLRRAMRDRAASEREAAALVRQLQSVMNAAPVGLALTRERRFDFVSLEFAGVLGYAQHELAGRPAREIFATDAEYDALGPAVAADIAAGRPFNDELRFRRRDGSELWGRLQGRAVDPADAEAGTIWLLENVTEQRAEFERLAWSAHHDALTRLANRARFEAGLGDLLADRGRTADAALLFIDLDRFKAVNDTAGHAAGDEMLRRVAAALVQHVRGSDLVARIGGDEFAVLLPLCDAACAFRIAEQMRLAVQAIGIEHRGAAVLRVGASIGIVTVDAGAASVAQLMASADAACYSAKRAGRDLVRAEPATADA